MADDRDPNEKTYPCRTCGRHFIKSSLVKHEPACKKLTKMQRKVFDSGKQRAQNSDIPYKAVKKAAAEKEKRHEEFIGAVAASKHVEHALKTGGPLPPPPKSHVPSDYVRCNYCGRNFNQTAAERHIPFCKEQHTKRGATVQQRSNSVGRVPTSKSLRSQSRGGSSRNQSRDHSPPGRTAPAAANALGQVARQPPFGPPADRLQGAAHVQRRGAQRNERLGFGGRPAELRPADSRQEKPIGASRPGPDVPRRLGCRRQIAA
ncbi:hypothetical protein M3Y99_00035700 [Aphelenchoides fujianensis]|nr:hypothetical protein M3Y99_00035700 [Aphelenchoides fujianensis]